MVGLPHRRAATDIGAASTTVVPIAAVASGQAGGAGAAFRQRDDDRGAGGDLTPEAAGRMYGRGCVWVEVVLAVAAFVALCTAVLSFAPQLGVEPDDGAYRASIVAMTEGRFLTLSSPQVDALAARLDDDPDRPPNQWVQLSGGRYISEKDPGYPFLAAPFQKVGIIRWAPLFYGALACVGLFLGARRWLGRFGGSAAVGLYCSSGAALLFAWREYMPTFTDASLIAAGCGVLVWAVLATDAGPRRRLWAGLAGFVGLEVATFVRYTDIVVLGCAVVIVVVAQRVQAVGLSLRTLCWWLASVMVFGIAVAVFDDLVYGGPLTSGYQPGEVSFGLGAIGPNLRYLPEHLMQAMPMLILAAIALVWIVVRWLRLRWRTESGVVPRRDLWVGLALAGVWLAVWALYAAYYWTNDPGEDTLQTVRFYVPAIGPMSLLGAWLVTTIPGRPWRAGVASAAIVAGAFALGVWSLHVMVAPQLR